jgi:hypothetical protein
MNTKYLTKDSTLDDFTGSYGHQWKTGILSEHRMVADTTPNIRFHNSASGATWAYDTNDLRHPAVRVVCSEVIEIGTEDGPVSGRCGAPTIDGYFCEGHAEQYGVEYDGMLCEHGLSMWLCSGPMHY